jgi:hypothetical protein
MSSVLENLEWHRRHAIDTFDWSEWVTLLGEVMPLPVYDLLRIVDGCAAHDIAVHARHWPKVRAGELGRVNVPAPLARMLYAVGLEHPHQIQYAARALYRQCAERTTGVPILKGVPVDHMDDVPVVPSGVLASLVTAADAAGDAKQLLCWLENVIVHGSSRPTLIRAAPTVTRQATGRRRRRAASARCEADITQSRVNAVLREITEAAPDSVPRMWCTATGQGQSHITIVLYARQRAPSDE